MNRHFVAIGIAGATYLVGSALNVLASSCNGGRIPTGTHAGALYWLGDRFWIIGAPAGFTRWASVGDFMIWGAELAIGLTWLVWAGELLRSRSR